MSSESARSWLAVIAIAAVAGAIAFWPSRQTHAGYPFARRVAGPIASPIWRLGPDVLERLTVDDAERLERFAHALDGAVAALEDNRALLSKQKIEELGSDDRKKIRELWWRFFEPMLSR